MLCTVLNTSNPQGGFSELRKVGFLGPRLRFPRSPLLSLLVLLLAQSWIPPLPLLSTLRLIVSKEVNLLSLPGSQGLEIAFL